jgi:hypothetical protein
VGRGPRLLALIGVLALGPACGGGGSPSEPPPVPTTTPTPTPTPTPSPTPTPTPAPGITFIAVSTGPGIVLGQGGATTATSLTVEVRAATVTALYGVAFDLDYPPGVVRYQSSAAGEFLGNSSQVTAPVVETVPGHLVVGVSRLGTLPGVSGSGVLLRLVFTPVANGGGAVTFSRNSAFANDGSALTMPWAAGTVTVSQ